MLKLTFSKLETRTIRGSAKQIADSKDGNQDPVERRSELREETKKRLELSCELFPAQKDNSASVLDVIGAVLKKWLSRMVERLKSIFLP